MTLKAIKTLAKQIGATVIDDKCGHTHECTVEAPAGKRWKCSEIHMLVDCANIPWKPDYADLLDRMAYGVEDCPDKDCEWCNSTEE